MDCCKLALGGRSCVGQLMRRVDRWMIAGIIAPAATLIASGQLLDTKNFTLHALYPTFPADFLTEAALTARCPRIWKH